MHKELRFGKQILEETFEVNFLSASCHAKFRNCCRDMTPGQWKTSYKVAQMSELVRKIFYTYDQVLPNIRIVFTHF